MIDFTTGVHCGRDSDAARGSFRREGAGLVVAEGAGLTHTAILHFRQLHDVIFFFESEETADWMRNGTSGVLHLQTKDARCPPKKL